MIKFSEIIHKDEFHIKTHQLAHKVLVSRVKLIPGIEMMVCLHIIWSSQRRNTFAAQNKQQPNRTQTNPLMNQVHTQIDDTMFGANEPTPDTWLKSHVDVIFLAFRPIPYPFSMCLYSLWRSSSAASSFLGRCATVRVSHSSQTHAHTYVRYNSTAKPHHKVFPALT